MTSVEFRNVTKRFGKTEVIRELSLEIEANQLTVLVGPSGCGKSTLLRMIAGLESPTSGDVCIDGVRVNDTPPFERGVGMVFQSYALYPHMTVYDNMSFGLTSVRVPKREIADRVERAAEMLGLQSLLKRKPKQLSGGQRQRVAMGRAIVRQPKVFLFDEPLSNLDAALRVKMRLEIARLREELKATMVYVTHDQVEAMTLSHKIVVLRAGMVEQVGSPMELYRNPKNKFVASFLGSPPMNFIPVDLAEEGASEWGYRLPNGKIFSIRKNRPLLGGARELGIRPEHLTFDNERGLFNGKVYALESLGDHALVYIRLESATGGDPTVVVKAPGESVPRPGDRVRLGVAPDHVYLFDNKDRALNA